MFCTQCGVKISDSSHFCCHCGNRVCTPPSSTISDVPFHAAPATDAPAPVSPEKKGRIWPPILILVILFGLGLSLFICFRMPVAVTDPAMPWFTVVNGTLYFDEALYVGNEELEVPSVIAGERVTAISDGCFQNCHGFCAIILPDGIEHIGSSAFAGCTSLRGLLIPETAITLGSDLFSGCARLEAVCIPYSIVAAGPDLFTGCEKLHHVFYPGPIESWNMLEIDMTDLNAHIYCYDGTIPPG